MNTALPRDCFPIPRNQWPKLLVTLPAKEITECADELTVNVAVEDVRLPRSGLGLLQLCDSALEENYFLGEIPIARAHVRLIRADGSSTEGAAQVMDDRLTVARSIAILDAVRAAQWPGFEQVEALLQKGLSDRQKIDDSRRRLLASTRVNFDLLGTADEEDKADA